MDANKDGCIGWGEFESFMTEVGALAAAQHARRSCLLQQPGGRSGISDMPDVARRRQSVGPCKDLVGTTPHGLMPMQARTGHRPFHVLRAGIRGGQAPAVRRVRPAQRHRAAAGRDDLKAQARAAAVRRHGGRRGARQVGGLQGQPGQGQGGHRGGREGDRPPPGRRRSGVRHRADR